MSNTEQQELMVGAAKNIQAMVDATGGPVTLKALKAMASPRMGQDHWDAIMVQGHLAGVLRLSRIDLRQLYGGPEQTGEVTHEGAVYHWVKPTKNVWER